MTTDDLGITIPSEQGGSRSSDLIGKLICLKVNPARMDEPMETAIGESEATWVEAIVVTPDGPDEYAPQGEVPIFWTVVRKQLHSASPWVVGRIRQADKGRSYRLFPPADAAELDACRAAVRRYNSAPIPYAGEQTSLLGDDDAPF